MVKFVNMGLKVVIYPDEDMVSVLEQNIGNHRFVWNKILERYGENLLDYFKHEPHGVKLKVVYIWS